MKQEVVMMKLDLINRQARRARLGAFILGCCLVWTVYCMTMIVLQKGIPGLFVVVNDENGSVDARDAGSADLVGSFGPSFVGSAHCVEWNCETYYMSSEPDSLPARRVITWRRIEGIYPNNEEAVMDIISCRYEPSGKECSEEEYEQLRWW